VIVSNQLAGGSGVKENQGNFDNYINGFIASSFSGHTKSRLMYIVGLLQILHRPNYSGRVGNSCWIPSTTNANIFPYGLSTTREYRNTNTVTHSLRDQERRR